MISVLYLCYLVYAIVLYRVCHNFFAKYIFITESAMFPTNNVCKTWSWLLRPVDIVCDRPVRSRSDLSQGHTIVEQLVHF